MSEIKSILALSGILPSTEFFQNNASYPLIATDGAGSELIGKGIRPQMIIGDGDSLDCKVNLEDVELISAPNQNFTDFEKALVVLKERDLLPCFIIGVSGKELDHTLYNLYVIGRASKEMRLPFLHSEHEGMQKLGMICHEEISLSLPIGTTMSLLPFPEAIVSTQGLTWELHSAHLHMQSYSSVRNQTRESTITISVIEGSLLILYDSKKSLYV